MIEQDRPLFVDQTDPTCQSLNCVIFLQMKRAKDLMKLNIHPLTCDGPTSKQIKFAGCVFVKLEVALRAIIVHHQFVQLVMQL